MVKKVTFDDVWAGLDRLEKTVAETSRIVGNLGNRPGEMVEHILTPNLTEQFKKYGFNFSRMGPNVKS